MTRVRDTVIGIASYYGREDPGFEYQRRKDRPWAPLRYLQNGYWDPLPGIIRPGSGADLTSTSSAEVKNEWSYTSTVPTVTSRHVTGRPFTNHEAPNHAVFLSGLIHYFIKLQIQSLRNLNLCSLLSTAKIKIYWVMRCGTFRRVAMLQSSVKKFNR